MMKLWTASFLLLLGCCCWTTSTQGFVLPSSWSTRRTTGDMLVLSATVEDSSTTTASTTSTTASSSSSSSLPPPPPPLFKTVMAANRAEIAVRIMRAATELNAGTVAIYCAEDRFSQHRLGADRSYELKKQSPTSSPISTYLDLSQIIQIAQAAHVDAIHPGYGFLSESPALAQACADHGIAFVGPTVENLETFSDKTKARQAAMEAGVPVVPGSQSALSSAEEVVRVVQDEIGGLPVILKASMGGGGKGMRVVRQPEDLIPLFHEASSEALAAFGDGSVFVERFVDRPKHIEIQIVGDGTGHVVHLWERDCSLQRRHQKVLEMAPAWTLPDELRTQLHEYAVRLTSAAKYRNAGTVEFLVDAQNRPYFIEVNPRIQVEHTVTEEVTGIDLVQAQLKIAAGWTLEQIGLKQENIRPRGVALQCRVTTEDPERDFRPDTGTITLYRHSAGKGVRMDGIGYSGLEITPYFDSMIVKYTALGATFPETVQRMKRVLQECRLRGVKSNMGFLLNVLSHPEFLEGRVTTSFIDENPDLKKVSKSVWNFANDEQADASKLETTDKMIRYMANLAVNGQPGSLGADPQVLKTQNKATAPKIAIPRMETPSTTAPATGWRKVLLEEGPSGLSKAVREHEGLLITDTTWRDAHQSLLATRVRTSELLNCADYTNQALANAFSLEMWGGATFDVSMRFLRECPWSRLEQLREQVPNIPFQMLLRGANSVGYTSYPDNVCHRFCAQAQASGIDVFRVFDSLNYMDNLQLGVEAAGSAGGFVEGTMSYTGNVADESKLKYSLDYYRDLARKLVDMGVHSLAIKDMAGLLTPRATSLLVGALRAEHPDMPIHVHTHDTAGNGVASMLAAAEAGADIVDAAIDSMSGMTSQPSLGALVANFQGTNRATGISLEEIAPLNSYWEQVRQLYAPFESGQLSGSSDVYLHEIPGGQYTNLLFQSKQVGLGDRWVEIKKKYKQANMILGDIPKVTPSSKVVGDLAQFMVSQNLDPEQVLEQAESLAFPDSVIQYLKGDIGIPPGGFPEPFRSKVLKSRGLEPVEGRPGASLPAYDFDEERQFLHARVGKEDEKSMLSYALYPSVYLDWMDFQATFGEVEKLPTNLFLYPMQVGDEVEVHQQEGRIRIIKLVAIEDIRDDGTRMTLFNVDGEPWYMPVTDTSSGGSRAVREKAIPTDNCQVGSPMSGVVVKMNVKVGNEVREGEVVATLSAMKMETSILAKTTGKVQRVLVNVGDKVEGDDLLMQLE